MGIDYFTCNYCGETFNNCGHYVSCNCGNSWCSDECAKKDGYRKTKDTCKFCRNEDFTDSELLKFSLRKLGFTRKEIINVYKKEKIVNKR